MTETYTEKEIEILKNYYSDKVINQIFDFDYAMRITDFETKKANNAKLFLNCTGYFINISNTAEVSIKMVAEKLALKLPLEVLNNLNEDK
jgi:hypothetical protein